MKPLSRTLTELIDLAEQMLTRPLMGVSPSQLVDLAREVRAAEARPAENRRTTRAALVMVIALEEIRGADRDEDVGPWQMLGGCALPMLRAEAYQALRNERGQG